MIGFGARSRFTAVPGTNQRAGLVAIDEPFPASAFSAATDRFGPLGLFFTMPFFHCPSLCLHRLSLPFTVFASSFTAFHCVCTIFHCLSSWLGCLAGLLATADFVPEAFSFLRVTAPGLQDRTEVVRSK